MWIIFFLSSLLLHNNPLLDIFSIFLCAASTAFLKHKLKSLISICPKLLINPHCKIWMCQSMTFKAFLTWPSHSSFSFCFTSSQTSLNLCFPSLVFSCSCFPSIFKAHLKHSPPEALAHHLSHVLFPMNILEFYYVSIGLSLTCLELWLAVSMLVIPVLVNSEQVENMSFYFLCLF